MKEIFSSLGSLILLLMATACTGSESIAPGPAQNMETPTPVVPPANQPFLLTQAMLDAVIGVTSPADSAITGNGFGVRTDGSDRNVKDIYTNKPLGRPIQTGDIFVIRSFLNTDGRRGRLDFIDLMVLRESGFNPGAGNFEYFRIDFEATTDYALHPNGMVPTLANSRDRGVDIARGGCVACHRFAPGGDFFFTTR